jgi:hypothetical protein
MSNTVCLPTEHYMLLMLFFISITLFYIYKMQNIDFKLGLNNNLDILSKQINILNDIPIMSRPTRNKKINIINEPDSLLNNASSINQKELDTIGVTNFEKRDYLEDRDKDAVFNEFKPPEKRLPEYEYPDKYVKRGINIPTRGLPDNYHALGTLVRKKDEKILQLFGRQTFPGSNQWEYYVSGADSYGFPNKMPIIIKGGREIEDKQKIDVPFLDKKNGDFEANIYRFDVPRYNPFDY